MTRVVIVGEIYNADLSVGGGPVYPGHPANRPPGSWGGPVDPGWGVTPPVDPGYGRPGWSPVDPGWGGGPPVYPGHGLPGGGHIGNQLPWGPGHVGGGPVYPGHPGNRPPGSWDGTRPDNSLPPGVELWPQPPEASAKPIEPGAGTSPENPIIVAPPSEGTVILVWVSGVGYRYVTIGEAEPK